jgi:2-polyprenyl-3-methyl-5-hydroxy-6-metoxy-1,4-benzoquinol methylase
MELAPVTQPQKLVDEHFTEVASYWSDIYRQQDVFALIHQQRRNIVLGIIDEQRLPPGSRMLDIGCGAGVIAIELARRGFIVNAIDSVPAMIELTCEYAAANGVNNRISAAVGDAHHLAFKDASFNVVVAMGVTPFLHSPSHAIREMSRVLKPGGLLIVNTDNRWRLTRLLDPMVSPLLGWLRLAVKRALQWLKLRKPDSQPQLVHMYSRSEFDRFVANAGLQKVGAAMIGFGPFTFMERKLLPDRLAVKVHRILQSCADRKLPLIKPLGAQYIVVARKDKASPRQVSAA